MAGSSLDFRLEHSGRSEKKSNLKEAVTVGFLVEENKRVVVIAQTVSEEFFGDCMVIGRKDIVGIKIILDKNQNCGTLSSTKTLTGKEGIEDVVQTQGP